MTKKFEFNWQIPVPEPLLAGCVFDRWTEEKDNTDLELACTFKVDEYGFFIYWKSEGRVRFIQCFCFFFLSTFTQRTKYWKFQRKIQHSHVKKFATQMICSTIHSFHIWTLCFTSYIFEPVEHISDYSQASFGTLIELLMRS